MFITNALFLSAVVTGTFAATTTKSGLAPQFSPVFPSNMPKATDVVTSYNAGPYDTSSTLSTAQLEGYPEVWKSPPTNSKEVKKVYDMIDWSKVPKAPVRKQDANGNWKSNSDGPSDPYCWWTSTNCLEPKASYLPEDIYTCPNEGDWGLNYDDGPFNKRDDKYAEEENPYAEPALYNFLAENNNQKATLFYIGSNVVTYPAAAKRALNDGHQLCLHTWSHPPMTTQTNKQIVAELYWNLKAIKEATGVTSKCWRPPQGDVDDRVRAIAWQMGLRTILWDEDTDDWNMHALGVGSLSPKKVDAKFKKWINNYKSGKDRSGHIVLEHELNSVTVNMSMYWMPKIQETFNVIPALSCNGISQPYWEENFVYPIPNTPSKPSTPISGTCASGSYGLGNGDGYNGACCKDQSDCLDDCISGKCNGPVNTQTPTKTTTKKTATTTTKKTTAKKTTTTTTKKTTAKKTTTTTTKKTTATVASGSCTPGTRGKKKGNGKTGYCCSSSDDCVETCRSGRCGL
ncbi:uncharacterized protein BX663DRAFT_547625 [Cokeromyces recurvatus]|uniref:uncharacterized protein n=1 Tax=Cokeromyces recurvatus TaxID=90255 RepID=UPI002220277D|nr:uncharacterized protein BX663DRAFT_547625 [Cokeromyces recurvatus]KAI7907984.1 hypothetical protein BX663DRAFT_547625 [Cokeromyces recurvatus]